MEQKMTTRKFLTQLAQTNNLPQERIEPIIQKLENEWFETADSLKEISDEAWNQLGIPLRIKEMIKTKLTTELTQPEPPQQTPTEVLPSLVENLLNNETNQELKDCIYTLQVIVANILKANPLDDRVRRLKISNPKLWDKVARHKDAKAYLTSLGFEEDRELLYMPQVNFQSLKKVLEELNEVAENIGLSKKEVPVIPDSAPVEFDPYKTIVTKTNPDIPSIASRENDPIRAEEEAKRLQAERLQQAASMRVERNPQVFEVLGNTIPQVSTQEESPDDENIQLRNIQSIMRQRESMSRFQSKRKLKLDKVKSQEFYTTCRVRVRFPNRQLLEGTFSVAETVQDVYTFVSECLEDPSKGFYLYVAPPKEVIKPSSQKLLNYAPATLFNFAWNNSQSTGVFLKAELTRNSRPLE